MKKDEDNSIYEFDGLKELLTRLGFQVEKSSGGYRAIPVRDVDINDLQNNIKFKDDGIFVIDEIDGKEHQVFLYKRKYHLSEFGKPKYHICKCRTIVDFMNRGSFQTEYRRANTEEVDVIDMDDRNKDKKVNSLPLCKNCVAQMQELYKDVSANMTSQMFVELLKQLGEDTDQVKEVEVDIFGYTKDWETISRAYRDRENYTCERCGIQITDPFDRQFIHVHHKNGIKTDNRIANLECLCIRCHSQVDKFHSENFSEGGNKILLDEFNKKYPEPNYCDDLPF